MDIIGRNLVLISSRSQRVKVTQELTEKKSNKNPMLGGTFLMSFWKSKCLSIFALTKGWLALETSLESLHGGQFATWYQQVLTILVGKC